MNTLKFGLIACITSFICFNAYAATTQVYRWIDSAGVVHYSETPPKNKEQPSELVTTKTQPGISAIPVPVDNDDNESSKDDEPSPEVEQVLKKDPETCKQATEALNSLMSKPIVRNKGKIMSIDEKNREIQNMKDIMKIHC